jgi:3-hydroxyisobutyrate dehydrogenase
MTTPIHRIGFVGLGSMGGKQAHELAKLPLDLVVYDTNPQSMQPFAGRATLAETLPGVATNTDVIGICVQDDAQVTACAGALLPAMKPGAVLLIHSTIKPATMIALGARATPLGLHVLDAAVSRTEMTADGPFVFCMTGGDDHIAQTLQPLLRAYATDTMHVGPLGSAMALKICNNLVSWCSILLGLEAVELAESAGVPLDKLLTVMKRNGVMTPPAQGFVAFRNNPGTPTQRALMAVQAGIGEKDLSLAEALAAHTGLATPLTTLARTRVRDTVLAICNR